MNSYVENEQLDITRVTETLPFARRVPRNNFSRARIYYRRIRVESLGAALPAALITNDIAERYYIPARIHARKWNMPEVEGSRRIKPTSRAREANVGTIRLRKGYRIISMYLPRSRKKRRDIAYTHADRSLRLPGHGNR